MRIGQGCDVHRLASDIPLIIGGVKIESDKGAVGHSDADCLTHAIMDALLGAAGMGDIGIHFPDTDVQYKGISSMKLLKKVGEMIKKSGFRVNNIDSTVLIEQPKIMKHAITMRENISKALNITTDCVNVKATTTEGLGIIGNKEAIAATASAILVAETA